MNTGRVNIDEIDPREFARKIGVYKISGTALAAGPYARRPMSVDCRMRSEAHLPLGNCTPFCSAHRIQPRSWGPAANVRNISGTALAAGPYERRTISVDYRMRSEAHPKLGDRPVFCSVLRIQPRRWGPAASVRNISGTALAAGPYARLSISTEHRMRSEAHLPLGNCTPFCSAHRIQPRSWGPAASAVPLICGPTTQVTHRMRWVAP